MRLGIDAILVIIFSIRPGIVVLNRVLSFIMVFFAMIGNGCTTDSAQPYPVTATLVHGEELPEFHDDLNFDGLYLAVQRQLMILRKERDREALRIGQQRYRASRLLASLDRFSQILSEMEECLKNDEASRCHATLSQKIRTQFLVYRVSPSLLTAYYTPTIEVSTQRTEKFRYPIYRTPDTEWERRLSREDIDFSRKLEGRGYELYYAANLFDLYITHVEGAARIVVNDAGQYSTKYLHYHSDNGREFTHIYEYMLKHDLLSPKKQSRFDQRSALERHPDKVREVFASSPGYVFFNVSDTPAITHTGIPLTGNRSTATDPDFYPVKGAISYIIAPLPVPPLEGTPSDSNPHHIEQRTMERFFIDQDIGHNVEGPARADLFFGEGAYAEFLSNNFMTSGSIYLLILK